MADDRSVHWRTFYVFSDFLSKNVYCSLQDDPGNLLFSTDKRNIRQRSVSFQLDPVAIATITARPAVRQPNSAHNNAENAD